jgi:hypothetical protein
LTTSRSLLFDPVEPMWRYCLIAVPTALVPSIILFAGALGVLRFAGVDVQRFMPPETSASVGDFIGAVIFSPVAETYLLAWLILCLSSGGFRPVVVASGSAVIWGCFHALFGALWFFGTVWSFFVFSCAFIAWRKISFKHAYVAAAVPHALINLSAVLFDAAVA